MFKNMRINTALLNKLNSAFRAAGVKIGIKDDFITLDLSRVSALRLSGVKCAVYRILNNCEKDYFIKILGIAPCLAPDAWDHFFYEGSYTEDLVRFSICRHCRFSRICPGLRKDLISVQSEFSPVPDAPTDIVFEITKKCNLRCNFCSHHGRGGVCDSIPFSVIRRVIDESRVLGIKNVRFTGGEPLLRPDLVQILRYAKTNGMTVFLNTNATLLSARKIKMIEPFVDNVLVSIVGYNADSEDQLGAQGRFFKDKIENIRRLRKSNIPLVRIGTVISKLLLDRFDLYGRLVSALRPDAWELYRPMIPGDSKDWLPYHHSLTSENYNDLLRHMDHFSRQGTRVYIANAFPFCAIKKSSHRILLNGARFDDGHERLVMDSEGFFKPSYFIAKNLGTFLLGAWKSRFMRKINACDYLPLSCGKCRYLGWCRGGSRYLANVESGGYFEPDPFFKKIT